MKNRANIVRRPSFIMYMRRVGESAYRNIAQADAGLRRIAHAKKDSFFDGGANRWQDARNDKTDRKGTKHTSQGTEREKQDYQDARRTEDQRSRARAEQTHKDTSQKTTKKDTSQSARGKDTSQGVDPRFLSKDAYVVLGVTYVSTQAQIKKAYMALIRKYHPDICKDPNATRISQAVNAAWDKLKKH